MGHNSSKSRAVRVKVSPSNGPGQTNGDDEEWAYDKEKNSFGAFELIPREVLVLIISQLSARDLAALALVSKGIYSIATSDVVWKHMYEKRWGRGVLRRGAQINWKVLYWKRITGTQDPAEDPYWDTLSVHTNDTSLDSDFATHTWSLNVPLNQTYRIFRIIQTGKNKYVRPKGQKDEWSDVLVASGFEIYGYLRTVNPQDLGQESEATLSEEGRIKILPVADDKSKRGIIQYLGGYPNVEVHASSLAPGKYVENFLSHDEVYVWTKNEKYSWFAVDLGPGREVTPTNYTLRYGSGGNYCCPRNWLLQGTNNVHVLRDLEDPTLDPDWTTLRVHINDCTLDSDWAAHSWSLPVSTASFRVFRIIQTGKNKYRVPNEGQKDSWSDVLVVSGFELYGTLYDRSKKGNVKEKQFVLKHTMDRNGIIHNIGYSANVKVYASSIANGKNIENFISKELHHNWTQNERHAWFAVDFGKGRTVCPTHYTLRYGSGGNLCCPRNWMLQATNNVDALKTQ